MELVATLFSPASEEAVIGSLLINPSLWDVLNLEPKHFYLGKHKLIWEACQNIAMRGLDMDYLQVAHELDRSGKLNEIGGEAFLVGVINMVPSSLHAEGYAASIRDLWSRREVVRIAQDLAKAAGDKDGNLDASVGSLMSELSGAANVNRGAVHWSTYLNQAQEEAEVRRETPGGCWGLRTGFNDFDYITGGLQLSELLLVAAEPGIGKSIWTTQLAKQLAENAGAGVIYSLEMLGVSVARRVISGASQVRTRIMKSGQGWTNDLWEKYTETVQELAGLDVYMSDADGWTTTNLRADLARLKRTVGIQWFVVDYSFLLADGDGKLNEIEKTALVIARLKGICKALNLAGIVIHSMNKAGINAGVDINGMTRLRGSGQVLYDADIILTMSMPDRNNPNLIRFEFGKGRELENPRGYFELIRLPELPWYGSVTTVNLNQ
jgi:replicative DNA helicase